MLLDLSHPQLLLQLLSFLSAVGPVGVGRGDYKWTLFEHAMPALL
jgi:hypothetical protein